VGSSSLLCCATGSQQLSAQRQTASPKAIRQKAKVTNADKAFGQHMQEEAAQDSIETIPFSWSWRFYSYVPVPRGHTLLIFHGIAETFGLDAELA